VLAPQTQGQQEEIVKVQGIRGAQGRLVFLEHRVLKEAVGIESFFHAVHIIEQPPNHRADIPL